MAAFFACRLRSWMSAGSSPGTFLRLWRPAQKKNENFKKKKKRKKILPRLMTAEPTHWGRFAAHNGPPFKKKKKWEPIFVWKIQSIRRLIEQVEKPMAMCTI